MEIRVNILCSEMQDLIQLKSRGVSVMAKAHSSVTLDLCALELILKKVETNKDLGYFIMDLVLSHTHHAWNWVICPCKPDSEKDILHGFFRSYFYILFTFVLQDHLFCYFLTAGVVKGVKGGKDYFSL